MAKLGKYSKYLIGTESDFSFETAFSEMLQNGFFDISNAEIAQCRQKLDVILVIKLF